ncbi:MAG: SPOR domain-containing protein [Methylococcales bacterium]
MVNKSVPTSHVLHKVSHYELQKAVKHELQQANKKLALENKKGVKPIITGSHIPKPKEQPSGPGWMVSLIAYEDERFAKRKAARLINQGIPVKVIPIHANKDKWYQLKVGGFKNKESAESYASKVKKSLKLSMVAVSFQ